MHGTNHCFENRIWYSFSLVQACRLAQAKHRYIQGEAIATMHRLSRPFGSLPPPRPPADLYTCRGRAVSLPPCSMPRTVTIKIGTKFRVWGEACLRTTPLHYFLVVHQYFGLLFGFAFPDWACSTSTDSRQNNHKSARNYSYEWDQRTTVLPP